MTTLTDRFGNKFAVGQLVIYPGWTHHSLWMNVAIIRGVEENSISVITISEQFWTKKISVRKTSISCVNRTVILPTICLSDDHFFGEDIFPHIHPENVRRALLKARIEAISTYKMEKKENVPCLSGWLNQGTNTH